jgi:hypothetical protein
MFQSACHVSFVCLAHKAVEYVEARVEPVLCLCNCSCYMHDSNLVPFFASLHLVILQNIMQVTLAQLGSVGCSHVNSKPFCK